MAEPSTVECPGCFQQKASEVVVCPRCGHNPGVPHPQSMFLSVQTQLRRYVIGEKLGQGGFGITYRGFDLKLRMQVAIKEYYPSELVSRSVDRKTVMLNSPENDKLFQYGLKAFVNEAHTLANLAQLQHPNLVRVLNLFEMNGTAYLVMDYYEGETLHDHLARQPDKKNAVAAGGEPVAAGAGQFGGSASQRLHAPGCQAAQSLSDSPGPARPARFRCGPAGGR